MRIGLALIFAAAGFAQDQIEKFEMKVRPLLAKSCFGCHTASAMGGLRLDSREALLRGGKSGAAVVVGKPEESLLVKVIDHSHERLKMPPSGKLSDPEIALLRDWVRDGLEFPARVVEVEKSSFWSFQPVKKVTPPEVKNTKWVRNAVDRFVLSRVEKEGLQLARMADRRSLLRRVSYDLTGLPPTPEETRAFELDRGANAWEKVVDR